ncbi:hypothetical protein AM593_01343, partial [Mytilus galloprovincialis]
MDNSTIDKKEAMEDIRPKNLKSKKLHSDVLLGKYEATAKLDDKAFVQQEYKRLIKDKQKQELEIAEGLKKNILEQEVQKERENFYRHSSVVLDLGKEALGMLLKHEISKSKITFLDFLSESRHDIYHCVYATCCQCPYYKPKKFKEHELSIHHLEILLNEKGKKCPEHRPGDFPQLCCSPVNHNLTIDKLDYVLLKCFLASFQLPFYVKQAVDDIETCRNESFNKAEVAGLAYVKYLEFKRDIQEALLIVCRYCNTEEEMMKKLKEVMSRPLDMTYLLTHQQKIFDAIEKITDKEIRNQVEEHVKNIELPTLYSETDHLSTSGKEREELMSLGLKAKSDEKKPWGKGNVNRKDKRGYRKRKRKQVISRNPDESLPFQ